MDTDSMPRPIRILHLITSLDTGGAEMTLARLMEGINRGKFESRVVSMIPIGSVGQKIRESGIPVETLDMRPGKPSIRGFAKLVHILRTWQPDILQTWLYHADLLGLLAGKLTGVPVIVWNIRSAEMDFKQYRLLSGFVFRLCALFSARPDTIIVNSQAGMRYHQKSGYRPRQWKIISNGINTSLFFPNPEAGKALRLAWGIDDFEHVVGMIARLDPTKDHKTFLQSAAKVQKKIKTARFICVGNGPSNYLQSLKEFAEQVGVQHIIWAGNQINMPAVYNALDLFVLASRGEGFPNVVAEAMACGIPCIASDVGDSAYMIADTGKIIPVGDSEALAAQILSMLDLSDTEKHSLGDAARNRILSEFSLENMINTYEEFYKKINQVAIPRKS